MNQNQTLSLVRGILKVVGGALAAHGATKAAGIVNSEDVIGVVMALIGLWTSHETHATDPESPSGASGKVGVILAFLLPLSALSVNAQTNVLGSLAQPVSTIGTYLSANTNAPAATNWTVAPYGSYAPSLKQKYGGGIAAVYYLTPYVGTQIRMQYLDTGLSSGDKVWLPNGTLTLQSAYQPFGASLPITLRPVIEAGVATDLRGQMYAIAGAGAELDVYNGTSTSKIRRVSLFYGAEQWQGQKQKFSVNQAGIAINFNLGGKGFLGLF